MPYETETVFSARPVPICEHWAYSPTLRPIVWVMN